MAPVTPHCAHDAVADEQIADPLLDSPDLRIIWIQTCVEQCLAVDRVHSHTRIRRARRRVGSRGDVTDLYFAAGPDPAY